MLTLFTRPGFWRPALLTLALPFLLPIAAAAPGGWFVAVLGIGFLIFIHEWGHYMACVLTKTRTEAFSVGFGPRLLGWERDRDGKRRFTLGRRQLDPDDHAMDFRIALIPLGGYVKMAGGEIIGESQNTDPAMFVNKSAWARIFIVCAGVIMNLITAVVFYSLAYVAHKEQEPNVIGHVIDGGPAWSAELKPGDRVVAINGTPVKSFYDLRMEVVFLDNEERATFTIERDGELITVKVLPKYLEDTGHVGIQVIPGARITIGAGEGALTIDFDEGARVADVSVRGGAAAMTRIDAALEAGQKTIPVEGADGATFVVDVSTLDATAEADVKPGPKVGLEQFAHSTVTAYRGDAAQGLVPGDVVIAALVEGGERVAMNTASAWIRLPHHAPVSGFVVSRADEETEVSAALDSPQAIADWIDDHAFERKSTNRVVPIEAGRQHVVANHLYRYPSSPAADGGVRPGDAVVKIGETAIDSFSGLISAIRAAESGAPIDFELESVEGEKRTITVTPVTLEHLGKLEIDPMTRLPIEVGTLEAFGMGTRNTYREVGNVFRTIGALFTGRLAFQKNIAGPARLVKFSKSQADRGVAELLWFLAYVSVMLAVLNILPIPVLDGGHLLFILIEKIKGSPLKEATVAKAMYIGLFLVLTLMFFAFKADFDHFFG